MRSGVRFANVTVAEGFWASMMASLVPLYIGTRRQATTGPGARSSVRRCKRELRRSDAVPGVRSDAVPGVPPDLAGLRDQFYESCPNRLPVFVGAAATAL